MGGWGFNFNGDLIFELGGHLIARRQLWFVGWWVGYGEIEGHTKSAPYAIYMDSVKDPRLDTTPEVVKMNW